MMAIASNVLSRIARSRPSSANGGVTWRSKNSTSVATRVLHTQVQPARWVAALKRLVCRCDVGFAFTDLAQSIQRRRQLAPQETLGEHLSNTYTCHLARAVEMNPRAACLRFELDPAHQPR